MRSGILRARGYRRGPGTPYRKLKSLQYLATRDRAAVVGFLRDPTLSLALIDRVRLLRALLHGTNHVRGYHTLGEMLIVAQAILRRRRPTVVEAGAAFGGSTVKLSLATARAGGRLYVFDSFKGIPPNAEVHEHLDGRRVVFRAGAFGGRLPAARRAVARFGNIDVCDFRKGWFADTLRGFDVPVDVALLDVDLVESTRTCLTALVPLMKPGGVIFSQDGHLRATVELLADEAFWRGLGVAAPRIEGLGRDKLLVIQPRPPF